eukprot:1340241-Alexandrium_andersonii.AAC.1
MMRKLCTEACASVRASRADLARADAHGDDAKVARGGQHEHDGNRQKHCDTELDHANNHGNDTELVHGGLREAERGI